MSENCPKCGAGPVRMRQGPTKQTLYYACESYSQAEVLSQTLLCQKWALESQVQKLVAAVTELVPYITPGTLQAKVSHATLETIARLGMEEEMK